MNVLKFSLWGLVLLAGLSFVSCSSDDERSYEDEVKELEAYLVENEISESAKQESGLYYIETTPGEGEAPRPGEEVKVWYTGMLLNGKVFDSNLGKKDPMPFFLGGGRMIPGFDEGVALMKKGGKARLILPSNLAYRSSGSGSIPPYSTIVFDVELLK